MKLQDFNSVNMAVASKRIIEENQVDKVRSIEVYARVMKTLGYSNFRNSISFTWKWDRLWGMERKGLQVQ